MAFCSAATNQIINGHQPAELYCLSKPANPSIASSRSSKTAQKARGSLPSSSKSVATALRPWIGNGAAATTAIYTSVAGADPVTILWDSQKDLLHADANIDEKGKNTGYENAAASTTSEEQHLHFIEAQLRLLANAASDRAAMHGILARQRDNWNKLFQRTLTATSLTACVLSALADQMQFALSLATPALVLNVGTAAMMAIINQFQPSQLAEEQRTAVRLFAKVASDIEYALQVAPQLRQHPVSFLRDCRRRLAAIDKAFPMPLTPGGLEKFPAKVVPPVLMEPLDDAGVVISGTLGRNGQSVQQEKSTLNINGWNAQLVDDLQHIAALLRRSDISKYTGWAQNLVKVNKCLAVAAPVLASSAALLNAGLIVASKSALAANMGMWAAICNVMAVFASSLSHDMQMGMVFELYRNSAGYYANVEASIKEALATPVHERENGFLFRQRVAYQLGRQLACSSIVPEDAEEAGTLF